MDPRRRNERRSLAMHRAVAERILEEPSLLEAVRERVARWLAKGEVRAEYARAWEEILALPLADLVRAMVEDSERGQALRQVSPFAGILSPRERWRIWREARDGSEA